VPSAERVGGTVFVFAKASIHVVDGQENPVAGARVVAAPTIEVMKTEEWVEQLRDSIKFFKAQGYGAWKFAIGTTDSKGVVELEYLAMTDLGDPLFGDGKTTTEGDFAFPTRLRIDSNIHGAVFQELRAGTNVRYRRNRAPGEPWGFAEATFVIRGDVNGKLGPGSDAAGAVEAERKGREASGEK
jgi:hypothetical protein